MPTGLSVQVIQPHTTIEIGDFVTSADWTTNALGGYGSASLTVPGPPSDWIRKTPSLALVRVTQDQTIVFEGQIEDHDIAIGSELGTTIQCFGLARLLSEKSIRRIWVKRDIDWQQVSSLTGAFNGTAASFAPHVINTIVTGQFEPTNLTRKGVRIQSTSVVSTAAGATNGVWWPANGVQLLRLIVKHSQSVFNDASITQRGVRDSVDGTTWNTVLAVANTTVETTSTVTLTSGAQFLQLLYQYTSAAAGSNGGAQFEDIRILGATTSEDASGGLYGGTILRDLVTLVPGLTAGVIDTGSEFTIEAIERAARSYATEVVEEVASYYTKEWGVYENGRLDWKTINLDEIHWITDVSQLEGLSLRTSIDENSVTEYVLYTDAASGRDLEASAASANRGNPYVLRGRAKDVLTSPGFPMTTNTSAQLASRLSQARGGAPFASGSCTLKYNTPVSAVDGGEFPAYQLKAGHNIKISGLPKTDPFETGRDGETLFHIVSTQTSLDGDVTLTLDSQEHAIDALLARLAAATRTITG